MRRCVWGSVACLIVVLSIGCSTQQPGDTAAPPSPESSAEDAGTSQKAVDLSQYRFPVLPPGNAPSVGPENAPVTMIFVYDYLDPDCRKLIPSVNRIHDEYGDKVRLVMHQLPMAHPASSLLAQAAVEAADQGKFWPMHLAMVEHADEFSFPQYRVLPRSEITDMFEYLRTPLVDIGAAAGLDPEKLKTALETESHMKEIFTETEAAVRMGLRNVPAVYVNRRLLMGGDHSYEEIKSIIDEELAWAQDGSGPKLAEAGNMFRITRPPWWKAQTAEVIYLDEDEAAAFGKDGPPKQDAP